MTLLASTLNPRWSRDNRARGREELLAGDLPKVVDEFTRCLGILRVGCRLGLRKDLPQGVHGFERRICVPIGNTLVGRVAGEFDQLICQLTYLVFLSHGLNAANLPLA